MRRTWQVALVVTWGCSSSPGAAELTSTPISTVLSSTALVQLRGPFSADPAARPAPRSASRDAAGTWAATHYEVGVPMRGEMGQIAILLLGSTVEVSGGRATLSLADRSSFDLGAVTGPLDAPGFEPSGVLSLQRMHYTRDPETLSFEANGGLVVRLARVADEQTCFSQDLRVAARKPHCVSGELLAPPGAALIPVP